MNTASFKAAAACAALGYLVSGAAVVGHSVPDEHWGTRGAIVDAAGAAAFAFTVLALAGLARVVADSRLSRWGTRFAQVGLSGMTLESIASLVHGGNTLGAVFFGGLVLSLVGLATFALAGLRAGQLGWTAPLPLLALLVGIAGGDHGGFLATGLVWLALAATARVERVAPAIA
jgi:hypothetical protein